MPDTLVIVNPRSAGGRTAARLDDLRASVARHLGAGAEVRVTERPGHASAIARDAALAGTSLFVAVGGDGTAHEVVNGLVLDGAPVRAGLRFALVPAGTGSDLARSLGVSGMSADDALALAGAGTDRATDVLDLVTADGRHRAVVNVSGCGINAEVVRRVNEGSKRLGPLTFLVGAVRALLGYRATPATVRWTGPAGDGEWRGDLVGLFVSNGQYCGGGMMSGPGGELGDGVVEVLLVPRHSVVRLLRGLPSLYDGSADRNPDLVFARATEIEVDGDLPVEADGETAGRAPARLRVVPGALRVVARHA